MTGFAMATSRALLVLYSRIRKNINVFQKITQK